MKFKGQYLLAGIPEELHLKVMSILHGRGETLRDYLIGCMRRLVEKEGKP